MKTETTEHQRLQLQLRLDTSTSKSERNRLGQFATPPALAEDILRYALGLFPTGQVRFLEPSIGTGSFYAALLRTFPNDRLEQARGYEVDPQVEAPSRQLWADSDLELHLADFTEVAPPTTEGERFNLIVSNPPYSRHHHLAKDRKVELQNRVERQTGIHLSQLAGLYAHFLLLCDAWMAEGGLAAWLIPSEFMDVNYGWEIKRYLAERVTLLHVHRFEPQEVQFDDALVTSAVVWFRNSPPPAGHEVTFSFGGSLSHPHDTELVPQADLNSKTKWTQYARPRTELATAEGAVRLRDLFDIKRGLATGDNAFFVLTNEQIEEHQLPWEFLRPILPSPRFLKVDEVLADAQGHPVLPQPLYLLSCDLAPAEIEARYPSLWAYLESGVRRQVDRGYLCASRKRWYLQEDRPAPLFLCTYMGRSRGDDPQPFRFVLNRSKATAANSYLLLYPKQRLQAAFERQPHLVQAVWQCLADISSEQLVREGRVYGGGLHKMEPKELANASAESLLELLNIDWHRGEQTLLLQGTD